MVCKECYTDEHRITPLVEPEDCLREHRQYVCSTCGRCICVDVGEKGARCFQPFGSLEIAKLYLRSAEALCRDICGIYELKDKRGWTRYRIFRSKDDLTAFLAKDHHVTCEPMEPVFISKHYLPPDSKQMRTLKEPEISKYLEEMGEKKRT